MISPYNKFFLSKSKLPDYTSRVFFQILKEFIGEIKSTLDIGCGTGSWLNNFSGYGVDDILGIDNYVDLNFLQMPQNKFKRCDLSNLRLEKRFDVVLCLEVAEHIPNSASDTLIESLIKHSNMFYFLLQYLDKVGVIISM